LAALNQGLWDRFDGGIPRPSVCKHRQLFVRKILLHGSKLFCSKFCLREFFFQASSSLRLEMGEKRKTGDLHNHVEYVHTYIHVGKIAHIVFFKLYMNDKSQYNKSTRSTWGWVKITFSRMFKMLVLQKKNTFFSPSVAAH
jgi:hypothetical protein